MNRTALLLGFVLDVLAILAVTVLGALRIVPAEAVIAFFGCVWAAGRSGGPPRMPPAAISGPPSVVLTDALKRTLIARSFMTLAELLARARHGRLFRPPGAFAEA